MPVLDDELKVTKCCAMRLVCLSVQMKGEGRDKGSGKGTAHNDSCKGRGDSCFPYCDQRKTVSA